MELKNLYKSYCSIIFMNKFKKGLKIVLSSVKHKYRWHKFPYMYEKSQQNPQILDYPELAAYKVYSQNGEDGILWEIMSHVGMKTKFVVEFGVEDGRETNTRHLIERTGCDYVYFDFQSREKPMMVHSRLVLPDNVKDWFEEFKIPKDLDVLSIDIDGYDYWVLSEILKHYKPRVIICEYNAFLGSRVKQTIRYDPDHMWDGSQYFGASLNAFVDLCSRHGYRLVCCEPNGVNAFFVRHDCAEPLLKERNVHEAFRPPMYGYYKKSKKKFVDL